MLREGPRPRPSDFVSASPPRALKDHAAADRIVVEETGVPVFLLAISTGPRARSRPPRDSTSQPKALSILPPVLLFGSVTAML